MPDHPTAMEVEMTPDHTIRPAAHSEMDKICNILANAFTDDPVLAWISGKPRLYGAIFRYEAEALYKNHSQVYINRDETGAAMWLPANVSHRPPLHWRLMHVGCLLAINNGIKGIKRALQLEQAFVGKQPAEPHFYLHAIGTELHYQGKGIGSALLKAGLHACDKAGLPAYLESSNENNNLLYQRSGFQVIGDLELPDNGPTVWLMYRDAQAPREVRSP